jgi:adenosylhomocysteine nucleosidase
LSNKIAIIAAFDREIQPLVKNWPSTKIVHDGCDFLFYEGEYAIAVCGGIGGEYARRAAEAAITNYSPQIVISAGIAGALVPDLKIGDAIFPEVVIDVRDGSRRPTAIHQAPIGNSSLSRTLLLTHDHIASLDQKLQLAQSYGAHAVDMEAAEVARASELHNLPFIAIKSISDELNFAFPEMQRFVRAGRFETGKFLLYVAARPWLWISVIRLARNTRIAADNLCSWLRGSVLTNTIVPRRSGGGARIPGA